LKICQTHGLGSAGFYQPRFRDGGKLHLKLMCFGAFWDPETNKYGEVRPMDGVKPPPVPLEFLQLVDRAIKDCHSLIAEETRVKNVVNILPLVKPDICLVNYYASTGRLGLHQVCCCLFIITSHSSVPRTSNEQWYRTLFKLSCLILNQIELFCAF